MPLAIPTIHMNGTSAESLLDAIIDARTALLAAMSAMGAVCPNGRDYYTQGDSAIQDALRQHANRLHNLDAVNRELAEIAEAIERQRR